MTRPVVVPLCEEPALLRVALFTDDAGREPRILLSDGSERGPRQVLSLEASDPCLELFAALHGYAIATGARRLIPAE